ncbi:PQQ-binding-like beta-propeller repeat protein [Actinoplanes sp. NPDC051494]|uniref:outer membrane protein assembly factor BamB family protein n=1 Tax=Actinoplanes sp. NPDC051494 TaxID=3363907 RepID=UPI0037B55CEC
MARTWPLMAAALLLAGCTAGDPVPRPSPPPAVVPTGVPTADAAPQRLPFGAEPLWSTTDGKQNRVELAGDALLTFRGDRLRVSDARTGAIRWSVSTGDPAPGGGTYSAPGSARVIGDPARDWSVVTAYRDGGERGLIGLSGAGGDKLWRIPAGRTGDLSLGPATSRTATAVLTTAGRTRTVAYDLDTREQAWTAAGVRPAAIQDDLVLVERTGAKATLIALDRETGKESWSLAARYPRSALASTAGSTLIVDRGEGAAVVDTLTGRELTTWPARLTDCGSSATILACADTGAGPQDDQAVTITTVDDAASVSTVPGSTGCRRLRVWEDLMYCSGPDGTARAITTTGGTADPGLPGIPEAIDARFAVFSDGTTLSVYAMS